ncbi:hypothetical protein NGA_0649800, partial [Nannochloropsis gaditana CCMP526]|uniref:uncharacterized protein n=1 Tax=Nannochloropsis gaditana (strain CCMP526) TaxID=1093141 RepID=UPI00029F7369
MRNLRTLAVTLPFTECAFPPPGGNMEKRILPVENWISPSTLFTTHTLTTGVRLSYTVSLK